MLFLNIKFADPKRNLKLLFRAYNLIIKRITKSKIIVEINTKYVKLVKNVFNNLTSLILISTMTALLVIFFMKQIAF